MPGGRFPPTGTVNTSTDYTEAYRRQFNRGGALKAGRFAAAPVAQSTRTIRRAKIAQASPRSKPFSVLS